MGGEKGYGAMIKQYSFCNELESLTKHKSCVINARFSRDVWVVHSAHRFVGGVECAASQSRWIRTMSGQLESQFFEDTCVG